jgi:hypothetical protein
VSEIADAVRADAADARAEIREAGVICPSCGQNYADLIGAGHAVEFSGGNLPASLPDGTAKCAAGESISLAGAGFETISLLAGMELLDATDKAWGAEMDKIIGTGTPRFTGEYANHPDDARRQAVIAAIGRSGTEGEQ